MDHVAIMKKSWALIPKILSGEKQIESRWYMLKCNPWGKIKTGESVYFKNSGEPVTAKATVSKVLQFENLTAKKVKEILAKYGKVDGLTPKDTPKFFKLFKNKKYCLLIFLSNPTFVDPFSVDKSGFGLQSAWLSVPHISKIKKP